MSMSDVNFQKLIERKASDAACEACPRFQRPIRDDIACPIGALGVFEVLSETVQDQIDSANAGPEDTFTIPMQDGTSVVTTVAAIEQRLDEVCDTLLDETTACGLARLLDPVSHKPTREYVQSTFLNMILSDLPPVEK